MSDDRKWSAYTDEMRKTKARGSGTGIFRDEGESAVYYWARHNSVPDPYDFSLMYAEHAGDEEKLQWLARRVKRDYLTERLKDLTARRDDLISEIESVTDRLNNLGND